MPKVTIVVEMPQSAAKRFMKRWMDDDPAIAKLRKEYRVSNVDAPIEILLELAEEAVAKMSGAPDSEPKGLPR